MDPRVYAYLKPVLLLSPVVVTHFTLYYLKTHASVEMQQRFGVDSMVRRDTARLVRDMIHRRRVGLEMLRKDYKEERDVFKLKFEDFFDKYHPDTPWTQIYGQSFSIKNLYPTSLPPEEVTQIRVKNNKNNQNNNNNNDNNNNINNQTQTQPQTMTL